MNRTARRRAVTLPAVATAVGAPAAAQQVLVIDTAAGRVVIRTARS